MFIMCLYTIITATALAYCGLFKAVSVFVFVLFFRFKGPVNNIAVISRGLTEEWEKIMNPNKEGNK